MPDLVRDADNLQLLLNEFELKHPDVEPPLAFACVLDNHGRQKFDPEFLTEYCRSEAPGVVPLIASRDARPVISADRLIRR